MILFCDFNPKIVRKYTLSVENENLIDNSEIYPSGLGIDMVKFAYNIGVSSEILLLKGNAIGDEITQSLQKMNISYESVKLKDDNLEEIIIENEDSSKSYKSKSPRITMEDKNYLLAQFEDSAVGKKIVVIPKINHESLDNSIYDKMVKFCYNENIKVAINPSSLDDIKNLKPYILMLDKTDLSRDINLEYTGQVLKMNEELLKKGVGLVFVNSKRSTIISTKEKNYRAYLNKEKLDKNNVIEKFNTQSALAGMAVAIDRDYDFITSIKLAIACGVCDNFLEDFELEMSSVKKLMNSVEVGEI